MSFPFFQRKKPEQIPQLEWSTSKYAALLIDMQPFYLGFYKKGVQEGLFSAQKVVLQWCVQESIPVAVLEVNNDFFDGGRTVLCLQGEIDLVSTHLLLQKSTDDGFYNTSLDEQLQSWNVTDLIVMGINASYCVKATSSTALAKGYHLHTARDLIADSFFWGTSFDWYEKNSTLYQNSSELISGVRKSLAPPNLESRVDQ